MNTGLVLIPISLLASLTFLLNRVNFAFADPDDDGLIRDGYGFIGIVVFATTICVLTLLVLGLID
jgi:hypothetical protein